MFDFSHAGFWGTMGSTWRTRVSTTSTSSACRESCLTDGSCVAYHCYSCDDGSGDCYLYKGGIDYTDVTNTSDSIACVRSPGGVLKTNTVGSSLVFGTLALGLTPASQGPFFFHNVA